MAAAEFELKSPFIPLFFNGGIILGRALTSFEKEGKGIFKPNEL
jgi:hypothetical protein